MENTEARKQDGREGLPAASTLAAARHCMLAMRQVGSWTERQQSGAVAAQCRQHKHMEFLTLLTRRGLTSKYYLFVFCAGWYLCVAEGLALSANAATQPLLLLSSRSSPILGALGEVLAELRAVKPQH